LSESDCIFCAIAAGEGPAAIIDSDEHTVAFMDINPATRGHALVIPRRHAEDLIAISAEDLAATVAASRRLAERMRDALGAHGINLLNSCGTAAWQSVFHFHIHVVPRWEDDPLELPWVPAAGDPEEIAATATLIRGGGTAGG
jgi:histidine triad (HIT) family protein